MVTVQLICGFVIAYAKSMFPHDVAQLTAAICNIETAYVTFLEKQYVDKIYQNVTVLNIHQENS